MQCGKWKPFPFQLKNGLCANCSNYNGDVCQGQEPPIPESEKQFYQPDEYYTDTDISGNKVIPFEQRKSGWKSKNGLYPAEILLLYYCSQGQYPRPAKGYPSFWWFEYGIRNVSYVLATLENRGFIECGSLHDALSTAQLKQLLKESGLSTAGKKCDLVERMKNTVPDNVFRAAGLEPKYHLTQIGKSELSENSYIIDIHKSPEKTTSDSRYGPTYNVDAVASEIVKTPEISWEDAANIRKQKREDFFAEQKHQHDLFLEQMKDRNLAWYRKMKELEAKSKSVDEQLAKVQEAENLYKESGDIEWYINFWESIWNNGGLLFKSMKWSFTLPDLYFKQKRFDDVIDFCQKIKVQDEYIEEKADKYIQRAKERKEKQRERI